MTNPFKASIVSIALFLLVGFTLYGHYQQVYHVSPIMQSTVSKHWLTVILIPLDSRPPCTQFVVELAKIGNINLVIPPIELLDNYNTPASKEELRNWLWQASKEADAAIISTDMLIHGSLVASRLSTGNATDVHDVIRLLTQIHQENPQCKLYVFNIIPRLILADSAENFAYQKIMLQYSVLKDQVSTFGNWQDTKKLAELEKQIPSPIISHYLAMYEENTTLNLTLMNMAEQEILAGVVIGQDDGQPFGIPNMQKQKLQHQLQQKPRLLDKVFITRGTDEVALTLLGHTVSRLSNYQSRIFVTYSTAEGPGIVMPFMPNTVEKTVAEKIAIAGGQQVATAEQADFILYVHVGTAKNKSTLEPVAQELKDYLDQGYKVALVDLSENFHISETLLPLLITKKIDIPKLIAYAGWNTTSNSIGTAVTQACIFNKSLLLETNTPEILALYQENLEFLTARFLDDLYYQKEINPYINKQLQGFHINPYKLDAYYTQTNYKIQKLMSSKAYRLLREALYNHPITINTSQGEQNIIITDLTIETHLPWQRTFEIWIKSKVSLGIMKQSAI